jgi:hypothetical protein
MTSGESVGWGRTESVESEESGVLVSGWWGEGYGDENIFELVVNPGFRSWRTKDEYGWLPHSVATLSPPPLSYRGVADISDAATPV